MPSAKEKRSVKRRRKTGKKTADEKAEKAAKAAEAKKRKDEGQPDDDAGTAGKKARKQRMPQDAKAEGLWAMDVPQATVLVDQDLKSFATEIVAAQPASSNQINSQFG